MNTLTTSRDSVSNSTNSAKSGIAALIGTTAAASSVGSSQLGYISNTAISTLTAPVAEVRIRLRDFPVNASKAEWYRLSILHSIASHGSPTMLGSVGAVPFNLLKKISRKFGFHDDESVVDPQRQLYQAKSASETKWWRKLLSMRSILLVLFFSQLVIAVAVAVAITYTAAENQALNIANTLMASISTGIYGELQSLFRVPLSLVMMSVSTLQLVQPPNITVLSHSLYNGFFETDAIANATLLYCGTPSGIFVGAGRIDGFYNDQYYINAQNQTTNTLGTFGINSNCPTFDFNCNIFNSSNQLTPSVPFNISTRDWFTTGMETKDATWTNVYTFAVPAQLGISAVAPVRHPITDDLLYVTAVDLLLEGISGYMSSLSLQNGVAFLCETDTSYLVATSDSSPLIVNNTRVRAEESSNPVIASISAQLRCIICDCTTTPAYDWNCTTYATELEGTSIYVTTIDSTLASVQLFFDGYGIAFVLIIAIPEKSFTSNIQDSLNIAIGASVAIIFASILVAFILITLITHQLYRTTKRLREFANMNFSGGVKAADLSSPIKEVGRVSAALLNMRASLRSFSKYVPLEVVKFLSNKNMEASLGGDRRYITIFFSDIADFTKISEKLDLDTLIELIGEYLEEMSNIVNAHSGMVDKYIGDAVMALWNVPVPVDAHPILACKAALACHRRLAELRVDWIARGFPAVAARIGIHSGEAITGNFGSKGRLNYTAIGDSVNLASRLEGLNKSYGTYLMISQETYSHVKDVFLCRPLDQVAVKGKVKPIIVYELICYNTEASETTRALAELFTTAFDLYLERQFEKAKSKFEKYLESIPGDLAATMQIENCVHFMNSSEEGELVRVMHEK